MNNNFISLCVLALAVNSAPTQPFSDVPVPDSHGAPNLQLSVPSRNPGGPILRPTVPSQEAPSKMNFPGVGNSRAGQECLKFLEEKECTEKAPWLTNIGYITSDQSYIGSEDVQNVYWQCVESGATETEVQGCELPETSNTSEASEALTSCISALDNETLCDEKAPFLVQFPHYAEALEQVEGKKESFWDCVEETPASALAECENLAFARPSPGFSLTDLVGDEMAEVDEDEGLMVEE